MAEITTQRIGEIQQATLKLLAQHPEGLQAKDVIARCATMLKLSPFEQSSYPDRPGHRRFDGILRFKSVPLVKAGWLVKSGGIWTITPEGKKALAEFKAPIALSRAARLKYREWKASQPDEPEEVEKEPAIEQAGRAVATLEEAEEEAWLAILHYIGSMPPYDFQELVGGLLRGMGYHVSHVAPPGRDQGTDITAHVDPLGIQGARIKVQVKRRTDKVDVDGVRAFLAVLGSDDVGIFVCTGGFTSEAQREARSQDRRKLMLVDASRLFELWVQHYEKVPDEQRRLLPLKPIYYLNLDS